MHPFLLTTPDGAKLARERVKNEGWAKTVLARLTKQATALEQEKLPVFEKDWWREASKKPWMDIYPEINDHTYFFVVPTVLKTHDTAIAYAATGNKEYAALVRKVLVHYTNYDFFAVHPDVGLNWSNWCLLLLQSYDIVHDTVSEADRAKTDDFFKRALDAIMKNDEWWVRDRLGGMYNNHFAWHKTFIGAYGLFYDRKDLIDYALNSDQGIRELVENGSKDDGIWLEGSINYHYTAVSAMARFATMLANADYPLGLWRHEFANGRSLAQLFSGPIQTLFPDRTLPTIGDTYAHREKLDEVSDYYAAYNACQLPEVAWILQSRNNMPAEALFFEHLPSGSPAALPMKTRLWPEHGYIALRTQEGLDYWKGDGFSAFLSYDMDGIHSHRDKFDLMVFARGSHVAVDAEARASARHAFSAQIQKELNHTTPCHNTVMVDGANHSAIREKLELVDFIDGPEIKLASVADTRGIVCQGVKMMRTVAATGSYVLDVFQVASNDEHVYDYLFHSYDDDGCFMAEGAFESIDLGGDLPWKWIGNARQRQVDGDWNVVAKQGSLTARLSVLGEPRTRLILCEFPKSDKFEKPAIPMLMAKRQAKSTVFVSVLQAERGNLPAVEISLAEGRHGLLRVTVNCGGKTREFQMRKLAAANGGGCS